MIHGAILRTDRLLDEVTEAEAFTGDAVCVFTTDGVQVKGKYRGGKGVFYKNDKEALMQFYATIVDVISEKLYEMVGHDEFIRRQNATLLRLSERARAGASAHEKNV